MTYNLYNAYMMMYCVAELTTLLVGLLFDILGVCCHIRHSKIYKNRCALKAKIKFNDDNEHKADTEKVHYFRVKNDEIVIAVLSFHIAT